MSKQIQVRPLDVEKWHGFKGKDDFGKAFTVTPLVDGNSSTYKTGLSPEEIKEYSEIFGMDLTPRYNKEKPHHFWDSETPAVKLERRTNLINVDEPVGYIQSKVLLSSKYVANSIQEYQEGLWPDAQFVIVDEDVDNEIAASKIELVEEAIIKASSLSTDKKAAIVLILSGKLAKGKSDNFIKVALRKEIDKDPGEVLRLMKMDAKQTATHALVLEALQRFILTKAGHRIMYHDSSLGDSVYEVVDYLEDKANQDLKLRIIEQLNK